MKYVVCRCRDDDQKPSPFPGSADAIECGCSCPHQQPPWPQIIFSGDCPVHELEHVKPN